jgi:predicted amidohydrolase
MFCCQTDIVWEDKKANYSRVHALLAAARIPKGSLVALPEMFATGFTMNVGTAAESADGPTAHFLAEEARNLGVFLMGGLVTATPRGRGRNQAVVFGPDGTELARYTKIQPFTLGGESAHYEAGNGVVTLACGGAMLAPFVCYDLRFPEVFRVATRRGAEILVVIANWPVKRIQHWVTLLQARAVENQCYVAGVNRCGEDPELSYSGRTIIVGPSGDILADAGDTERVISAELDLPGLRALREGLPFLKDMRDDYDRLQ